MRPRRRLLITATDTETGDLAVWDRDAGIELVSAVASSCAVPGVYPPVTIDGRRYMDGGIRSGTNADLAAGADTIVVLEPLAHLVPRTALAAEIEASGARSVVTVAPDEASVEIFGVDVLSPALWRPAFEAGLAQASVHVAEIGGVWGGAGSAGGIRVGSPDTAVRILGPGHQWSVHGGPPRRCR